MNIGARIKARRKELGLSVDEVAAKINKNRATVYRYESNEIDKFPLDILYPLAEALQTTPAYLMGWDADDHSLPANLLPMPEMRQIPLIGSIACGKPILAEEHVESYIDIPKYIKADFALTCKGDSMINARIYDGDIVYIRTQTSVETGEIAAVLIDNEATLKRFYHYPEKNMLILKAENPKYEDFIFIGSEIQSLRILGKAVAFTSSIR